ncbi:MAG: ATP-dependent helicase HrpB, partial [Rubricella sp.]
MPLPVEDALPALLAAIEARGMAVLQAPPGAGKTTRVPIALLETRRIAGRIVMLEPRRIAARAAAERMAETLGEPVGRTVGYRIRGESRVSARTRIEVVTEGILTRMIQSDPDLPGIGCVVFDEFHERSLNGDLGLALALECRAALREDLVLLPMSATLDAAPLARLLGDAPVITSRGRAFPVDLIYAEKPARGRGFSAGRAVADAALRALDETEGAILAFLPGIRDLGDAQSALAAAAPGVPVRLLHGGLDLARQRAVLDPGRGAGRRIVLATAIAETSLTVPDVRVVIDAGLARRARFDPGSGMTRLVTERASRAEADQRAGRAGRIAPGRCYRLWTRGEEGAMPSHPPAEIETADLASLALELAVWGSDTPTFLTRPPDAPLAEARALLRALGALDDADRATAHGREMAAIPAHPRIAHMLLAGGGRAAPLLAALLTARPGRRAGADLTAALDELARGRGPRDVVSEAERLARLVPARTDDGPSAAGLLTLAYPDRIAQRRPGGEARYLLSGGKGAVLDSADALASADYLAVGDLDGDRREARIRAALPLS